MNTLNPILATLLRIGGALAGIGGAYLVPDAKLLELLAAVGQAGVVETEMLRIGAFAIGGIVGFVIASQIVGLIGRPGRTPHGTRSEAAESVPRLRRHLVGDGQKRGSVIPDYLDPDPAPTKPVAVSFAELGLDHPHASEYPMPAGHGSEDGDDLDFAETRDRPEHAGSASDEWDAPAPNLASAVPGPPPHAAGSQISPARAEAAAQARLLAAQAEREAPVPIAADPVASEEPVSAVPSREDADPAPVSVSVPMPDELGLTWFDEDDAPAAATASLGEASPGYDGERECAAEAGPASRGAPAPESAAPVEPAAAFVPPRQVAEAYAPPPAVEPAQPRFSLSSASESDWYDGAGDEEEDAEDDGAGYGSLIDIGLGKSHAPRGQQAGQRGEAGLVPMGGAIATVPHGKPQDFRLREALAELQRLDRG
ncbi:hypothetical protein [Croceicoccus sp. BE223]|uniref:hypothetical protein n=1 Tax=Croceicoccus sp. BE223 TaxID=2817716 RepID=UPI0028625754|nr:hypothetical protein [Croceicoccus sp. BE223]MDR7102078.1 hypothetical protein [Croceicoccus sp. BE223]